MMKKIIFLCFLIISSRVFAETIPNQLIGIWEGKDRYVFFEENVENQSDELVIVLKEYYGWYLDRAAESEQYSQKEKRIRNSATHKTAEHIKFSLSKNLINQNPDVDKNYEKIEDCVWEFLIDYSSHEKNLIPVFVNEDKLYFDFYVKTPEWDEKGNLIISNDGFWTGVAETNGFTLNSQIIDQNIGLLIIDNQKKYDVRYWYSDMDFDPSSVKFIFESDEYTIPRHIFVCGNNYSSVSGRSKIVRNPVKAEIFSSDDFIYNSQKTVMAKKSSLYLQKLADRETFQDLMDLVKLANSRRKSDPPPLFPEKELDWHWDLIDMLEKDNQLIQEVRARQNQFGKRGKDINK